jgi:hypothetical protein
VIDNGCCEPKPVEEPRVVPADVPAVVRAAIPPVVPMIPSVLPPPRADVYQIGTVPVVNQQQRQQSFRMVDDPDIRRAQEAESAVRAETRRLVAAIDQVNNNNNVARVEQIPTAPRSQWDGQSRPDSDPAAAGSINNDNNDGVDIGVRSNFNEVTIMRPIATVATLPLPVVGGHVTAVGVHSLLSPSTPGRTFTRSQLQPSDDIPASITPRATGDLMSPSYTINRSTNIRGRVPNQLGDDNNSVNNSFHHPQASPVAIIFGNHPTNSTPLTFVSSGNLILPPHLSNASTTSGSGSSHNNSNPSTAIRSSSLNGGSSIRDRSSSVGSSPSPALPSSDSRSSGSHGSSTTPPLSHTHESSGSASSGSGSSQNTSLPPVSHPATH